MNDGFTIYSVCLDSPGFHQIPTEIITLIIVTFSEIIVSTGNPCIIAVMSLYSLCDEVISTGAHGVTYSGPGVLAGRHCEICELQLEQRF